MRGEESQVHKQEYHTDRPSCVPKASYEKEVRSSSQLFLLSPVFHFVATVLVKAEG